MCFSSGIVASCSNLSFRLNAWKDEIESFDEVSHSTTGSKVIKACNFPVSIPIKEFHYRKKETKSEKIKCIKCLQDLIQLHENTYMLPYEVLNGEGKAILHSFTAPNQHYVKEVFDQIESRHGTSVETLADAVISARSIVELMAPLTRIKLGSGLDLLNEDSIESFLHSRLLIQLLCEHYISLHKGKPTGAISLDTNLVDVIEDAKQDANQICDANLGVCPEVIIQPAGNNESTNYIARPLIRSWSHHAIVELSKNAMKSNVEKWRQQPLVTRELMPPPVYIKILRNTSYLSIQVIDHGVGLDEERKQKAFRFASSSSKKRWDRLEEQQSYAAVREPLGSLGVGLPISRMMLRVFGGDLDLVNRDDNSGCNATIQILYDDSITAEN